MPEVLTFAKKCESEGCVFAECVHVRDYGNPLGEDQYRWDCRWEWCLYSRAQRHEGFDVDRYCDNPFFDEATERLCPICGFPLHQRGARVLCSVCDYRHCGNEKSGQESWPLPGGGYAGRLWIRHK